MSKCPAANLRRGTGGRRLLACVTVQDLLPGQPSRQPLADHVFRGIGVRLQDRPRVRLGLEQAGIMLCSKMYSAVASASCGAKDRSLRPAAIPHPPLPIVSGPARIACARRGHYARRSRVVTARRGSLDLSGRVPGKEDRT
jgi:hypothetical protein